MIGGGYYRVIILTSLAVTLTFSKANASCTKCPVLPRLTGEASHNCECAEGSFYNHKKDTCVNYIQCPGLIQGIQTFQFNGGPEIREMLEEITDNLVKSANYEEFSAKAANLMSKNFITRFVHGTEYESQYNRYSKAPDFEWLIKNYASRIQNVLDANEKDISNLIQAINNRRLAPPCGQDKVCRLTFIIKRNRRSMTQFVSKVIEEVTSELSDNFEALAQRAASRHCRHHRCPTIKYLLGHQQQLQNTIQQVRTYKAMISSSVVDSIIKNNEDGLEHGDHY